MSIAAKAPTPLATANAVDSASPRLVLTSLWTTLMFVFAYVDIFGFWRADLLKSALAGTVPNVGFTIDQRFLVLTTLYVLLPSLMVAASTLLTRRILRPLTIVLAGMYAASIVVACIGETWVYFLLGSAVEIVLLFIVMWVAWRWTPALESAAGEAK